jgi:hypothetical protein
VDGLVQGSGDKITGWSMEILPWQRRTGHMAWTSFGCLLRLEIVFGAMFHSNAFSPSLLRDTGTMIGPGSWELGWLGVPNTGNKTRRTNKQLLHVNSPHSTFVVWCSTGGIDQENSHSQRHRTIQPMTAPIQQKQKVNPPCRVRAPVEDLGELHFVLPVSRSRGRRGY